MGTKSDAMSSEDNKNPWETGRINVSTGTKWETLAGYSRAVRVGNIVEVAGTTAINKEGAVVGVNDIEQQTRYILDKIEKSLVRAGASKNDVVRTRLFVTDISSGEIVSRVHGEIFKGINPACTLVEISKLIQPDLLIEIEATAVIF